MNEQRKRIQLLPEHIINQIKAGEVIDRPSSLLKEIIENSLDAESTKIDIQIIDNGLSLISLEDNGKGIDIEELPFAFARHATSKLEKFEDLYALNSFGFRGEALASIASIARVTCSSDPRESTNRGGKIQIEGGVEKSIVPYTNSNSGTVLYIKDLFFNTPVRLKFIKSKITEKNAIKRILYSFFIAHPHVTFSLRFDDKEKKVFSACHSRKERIQLLFSKKEEQASLLFFDESYEDYKLQAFFIPKKKSLINQNFLFINNRLFMDKGIHQSLVGHLDQLIPDDDFNYVLFFEAPVDEVDVNIHPGKTEVKFFKTGTIYSLLSASLKKNFQKKTMPSIGESKSENTSNPSPSSFSPYSAFFQNTHESKSLQNKINFLINILPCYQLLLLEEKPFLLHAWHFACFIFEKKVIQELPLKEEGIIPLLVAEPYPFKNNLPLEQYKEWGIELDILSRDTFVLRTIPEAIKHLPYRLFIQELIRYGKQEYSLKKLSELKIHSQFFLQENHLPFVLEEINELQRKNILVPLDEAHLLPLFHRP